MKRLLFILLIFAFQYINAETYQTKGNLKGWRSWTSKDNWIGGKFPPNPLPHGDRIIISEGDSMFYDRNTTLDISTAWLGSETFLTIKGVLYTKQDVNLYYNAHIEVTGKFLINANLYMAWSTQIDVKYGGYMGVSGLAEAKWGGFETDFNLNIGGTFQIPKGNNKLGGGLFHDNGTYIKSTPEFPDDETLPIELKTFTVNIIRNTANFKWITASEENNDYFTIEQSTDLKNWDEIHTQQGAGFSSIDLEYVALVKMKKSGIYYFRLKQTDYDGKYTYSKIISAKNEILEDMPIPKIIVKKGEIIVENDYNILQVYNMQGHLIKTYHKTHIISDLQEIGILIFVFDNKYKQKISKMF